MTVDELTEKLRQKVGYDAGVNKIIKLDFGQDGIIRFDGTVKPNVVDNDNGPADCTVRVSLDLLKDMIAGRQSPQAAFMFGKLKIEGDMSAAMQLGKLLG